MSFFDFFRRRVATVHFEPKVEFIGEQAGPAEARGAPMNTEPVPTVDDRSIYARSSSAESAATFTASSRPDNLSIHLGYNEPTTGW